jgi:hypothetical protein
MRVAKCRFVLRTQIAAHCVDAEGNACAHRRGPEPNGHGGAGLEIHGRRLQVECAIISSGRL